MLFDLPPDPPKLWVPQKPAIIRSVTPDLLVPRREALIRSKRRGAALPPVDITHVANAESAANTTSCTFSAVAFGAEHAKRYLAVAYNQSSGNSPNVTGITIGGVAASLAANFRNSSGAIAKVTSAIAIALVPTGTSGNIVVTTDTATSRQGISVYRLVDLISTTPTSVQSDVDASNPATASLPVLAGGCAIAVVGGYYTATGTSTWAAGMTETADSQLETGSANYSTAYASVLSATTISISVAGPTVENSQQVLAAVAFR